MRIKFLVVLLAGASLFAACKKDNNENIPDPQAKLPEGQYRLVKSVQYDKAGKDSATVNFPISTLHLSFNQETKKASVLGVPESVSLRGTYDGDTNGTLSNASIAIARAAATPNDLVVIGLLETGTNFEGSGATVTIKAKDHGYLVFSTQK